MFIFAVRLWNIPAPNWETQKRSSSHQNYSSSLGLLFMQMFYDSICVLLFTCSAFLKFIYFWACCEPALSKFPKPLADKTLHTQDIYRFKVEINIFPLWLGLVWVRAELWETVIYYLSIKIKIWLSNIKKGLKMKQKHFVNFQKPKGKDPKLSGKRRRSRQNCIFWGNSAWMLRLKVSR